MRNVVCVTPRHFQHLSRQVALVFAILSHVLHVLTCLQKLAPAPKTPPDEPLAQQPPRQSTSTALPIRISAASHEVSVIPRSPSPNAALGVFGQELMHQWVTETYKLLPAASGAQLVFRDSAPAAGLEFSCLQDQILTVTAYHLSYLKPQSRVAYRRQAFHHQSLAIDDLKSRLSKGVTLENSYALLMTSAILLLSTFAGYSEETEAAPPLDTFCDIVRQLRGIVSLGKLAHQFHQQPRGFFFHYMSMKHDFSGLADIAYQLIAFQRQLHNVISCKEEVLGILIRCTQALLGFMYDDQMGRTLATIELRIAFVWPLLTTDEYIKLLKARNQGALTVLLFYCVILQKAELDCWVFSGWAKRLADAASALITEQAWVDLAGWPLEEMERIQGKVEV